MANLPNFATFFYFWYDAQNSPGYYVGQCVPLFSTLTEFPGEFSASFYEIMYITELTRV
jgi:hypothetical protein